MKKHLLFFLMIAHSLGAMNTDFADHTEWNTLQRALWKSDLQAARHALANGTSVYQKTKDGKTARHFLAQHNATCWDETGKLACVDEPCIPRWPKDFLAEIQGECMMCGENIEEVGNIYSCGHVVHTVCAVFPDACPSCHASVWVQQEDALQELPHNSAVNERSSSLMMAILDNRYEEVEDRLEAGENPDGTHSFTPLHKALYERREDLARLLIKHGANLFARHNGRTPRHMLSQHGRLCHRNCEDIQSGKQCPYAPTEWSKEFLRTMNGTCVLCSKYIEEMGHVYQCGHVIHKVCARLPEQCPTCCSEAWTAAPEAAPLPNPECAREIPWKEVLQELPHDCAAEQKAPQQAPDNLLFQAVHTGTLEEVKELLAQGKNPNGDGSCTPLRQALHLGDEKKARLLLRYGANPIVRDGQYTPRHVLRSHIYPCRTPELCGKLFSGYIPCPHAHTRWSKEFLRAINGACVICTKHIEELGHIYDCGHVIHKACVQFPDNCPQCTSWSEFTHAMPFQGDFSALRNAKDFIPTIPSAAPSAASSSSAAPAATPAASVESVSCTGTETEKLERIERAQKELNKAWGVFHRDGGFSVATRAEYNRANMEMYNALIDEAPKGMNHNDILIRYYLRVRNNLNKSAPVPIATLSIPPVLTPAASSSSSAQPAPVVQAPAAPNNSGKQKADDDQPAPAESYAESCVRQIARVKRAAQELDRLWNISHDANTSEYIRAQKEFDDAVVDEAPKGMSREWLLERCHKEHVRLLQRPPASLPAHAPSAATSSSAAPALTPATSSSSSSSSGLNFRIDVETDSKLKRIKRAEQENMRILQLFYEEGGFNASTRADYERSQIESYEALRDEAPNGISFDDMIKRHHSRDSSASAAQQSGATSLSAPTASQPTPLTQAERSAEIERLAKYNLNTFITAARSVYLSSKAFGPRANFNRAEKSAQEFSWSDASPVSSAQPMPVVQTPAAPNNSGKQKADDQPAPTPSASAASAPVKARPAELTPEQRAKLTPMERVAARKAARLAKEAQASSAAPTASTPIASPAHAQSAASSSSMAPVPAAPAALTSEQRVAARKAARRVNWAEAAWVKDPALANNPNCKTQ